MLPALQLTLARGFSNALVSWPSGAKDRFEVQHRSAMDAGAWLSLVTNWPAGTSNRTQFLHTNSPTNPAGFYRVTRSP